jgi:hypothetical protein
VISAKNAWPSFWATATGISRPWQARSPWCFGVLAGWGWGERLARRMACKPTYCTRFLRDGPARLSRSPAARAHAAPRASLTMSLE